MNDVKVHLPTNSQKPMHTKCLFTPFWGWRVHPGLQFGDTSPYTGAWRDSSSWCSFQWNHLERSRSGTEASKHMGSETVMRRTMEKEKEKLRLHIFIWIYKKKNHNTSRATLTEGTTGAVVSHPLADFLFFLNSPIISLCLLHKPPLRYNQCIRVQVKSFVQACL